jgi:hypothetical protein
MSELVCCRCKRRPIEVKLKCSFCKKTLCVCLICAGDMEAGKLSQMHYGCYIQFTRDTTGLRFTKNWRDHFPDDDEASAWAENAVRCLEEEEE